ncbi:MAG: nucleotidyltransferase family protein [Gammaproteobacteria bacterium]|nr:nucleotidyltransferase family protein [Gammaproteobacteria bacterium]
MHYSAAETSVVLLAAGRGKRMLQLTRDTPKPLLKVGDCTLIEYHLKNLQQQGFRKVIINLAYLGNRISKHLGDGTRYGLRIVYSDESATGALETAGGLQKALPKIDSDPFVVVNADIWTDYPFAQILRYLNCQARLVMVKNPAHNRGGDFSLPESADLLRLNAEGQTSYTFSGIALYRKGVFARLDPGVQALAPIFHELIARDQIEGEIFRGQWQDIGTPERLAQLNHDYLQGLIKVTPDD